MYTYTFWCMCCVHVRSLVLFCVSFLVSSINKFSCEAFDICFDFVKLFVIEFALIWIWWGYHLQMAKLAIPFQHSSKSTVTFSCRLHNVFSRLYANKMYIILFSFSAVQQNINKQQRKISIKYWAEWNNRSWCSAQMKWNMCTWKIIELFEFDSCWFWSYFWMCVSFMFFFIMYDVEKIELSAFNQTPISLHKRN